MRIWTACLLVFMVALCPVNVALGEAEAARDYQLQQVVVLSRHNIRAPLSNSGSAVAELTPHTWTEWTALDSELTLKGGIAETRMGQYFRKWLESEGLIPENWIPAEGEARFYANARQRTIATAQYFAAGMLPVGNVTIESHGEIGDLDPVIKPVNTFSSEAYSEAVRAETAQRLGLWEDGEARQALADQLALLADVIDFEESHGYTSGEYGPWAVDDIEILVEKGKETSVKGSIKTAQSAADALMLQYYELDDAKAAAFGHELSDEDWASIADITALYQMIRYSSPLLGVNAAHPMLQEILNEYQNQERRFSFICGHDSNVATVLSALGVGDYSLPNTIEHRTPIGVKLLFERWSGDDGGAYARVRLVYPSTQQLRTLAPLMPDDPPMSFDVPLPGIERNTDGFYRLDDVYNCIQRAIDAYYDLFQDYSDIDSEAQSIGLEGVGNARELGGYAAEDGRTVKRGAFLRTAALGGATEADIRRLREVYNLSVVADLRMTSEVESAPDPEIEGVKRIHLGIIDEEAVAESRKNLGPEDLEGIDTGTPLGRLQMAVKLGFVGDQMYIGFLSADTGKAGYAQLFKELIEMPEDGALLFHCTQGKDRTGCAALLILSALGVDEQTILEDFALTNTFNAELIERERQMLLDSGIENSEIDSYLKLMDEVDIRFMIKAIDWIKENYGSVMNYITEALGVSESEIELLRDKFLEPAEIEFADAA